MAEDFAGGLNLEALRNKFRKSAGATVAERKEAERRALAPTDGRRLRSGVRTVQVNLRVTPEFKEQLYELAREKNLTMTEVVERGVALLLKDADKNGG
jgi:hypothetical protein